MASIPIRIEDKELPFSEYLQILSNYEENETLELDKIDNVIIDPVINGIYITKKDKIDVQISECKNSEDFFKKKMYEIKKVDDKYKFKNTDNRFIQEIRDSQGLVLKESAGELFKSTYLIGTHFYNNVNNKCAKYVSSLRKFTYSLKNTEKLLVLVHYLGRSFLIFVCV